MSDIPRKLKVALGENLPENSMIVSKDLYDKFMQLPGATEMTHTDMISTYVPICGVSSIQCHHKDLTKKYGCKKEDKECATRNCGLSFGMAHKNGSTEVVG